MTNGFESALGRKLISAAKIIALFVALDVFFTSIGLLGAFKSLGKGQGADLIQELAGNPFIGLMLGILVTSVIQSSSTTTSIVVGLVAGGAFGSDHAEAIRLAVPVIMGANIGTSITNLLVSMAHIGNRREFERAFSCAVVHDFFNIIAVAVFLPLQIMTDFLGKLSLFMARAFDAAGGFTFSSPIMVLVKPQTAMIKSLFESHQMAVDIMVLFVAFLAVISAIRWIAKDGGYQKKRQWMSFAVAGALATAITMGKHFSEAVFCPEMATFLFGLSALFASLFVIVKVMRSVVLKRLESLFHGYLFKTAARAMVVGMFMTALVQSSSVTTSIVVPLAGAGILSIHQIFPYTLGANVGTTITAILAALSVGEVTGIAVAFAHLSFNIIGICVIYPFRRLPIGMATGLSRLAVASKAYPVVFVLGMYLALPTALIFLFS